MLAGIKRINWLLGLCKAGQRRGGEEWGGWAGGERRGQGGGWGREGKGEKEGGVAAEAESEDLLQ